jgi:hypothetical protein
MSPHFDTEQHRKAAIECLATLPEMAGRSEAMTIDLARALRKAFPHVDRERFEAVLERFQPHDPERLAAMLEPLQPGVSLDSTDRLD